MEKYSDLHTHTHTQRVYFMCSLIEINFLISSVANYLRNYIPISQLFNIWEGQYLGTNSIDLTIQAMKPFRNSD